VGRSGHEEGKRIRFIILPDTGRPARPRRGRGGKRAAAMCTAEEQARKSGLGRTETSVMRPSVMASGHSRGPGLPCGMQALGFPGWGPCAISGASRTSVC